MESPELTDIGHNHFVYGSPSEIAKYKEIREKGVPLKTITILPEGQEAAPEPEEKPIDEAQINQIPLHDTGSPWYTVASFFLAPLGLIAGLIFKKFRHKRNAKACFKGALIGLCTVGAIVAIYLIFLLLALL